jgi:hypothetical protein
MSPRDPFDDMEQTDEFAVDFTGMAESEPKPGEDYTFVCVDVLANQGRESGIPKLEFVFHIWADKDGKKPKDGLPCEGWESSVHCSQSKSALWKMEEVITALALGKPGQKIVFKRLEAVGTLVLGHVMESTFRGRRKLQIEFVGPYHNPGKKIKVEAKNGAPF